MIARPDVAKCLFALNRFSPFGTALFSETLSGRRGPCRRTYPQRRPSRRGSRPPSTPSTRPTLLGLRVSTFTRRSRTWYVRLRVDFLTFSISSCGFRKHTAGTLFCAIKPFFDVLMPLHSELLASRWKNFPAAGGLAASPSLTCGVPSKD